MLLISVSYLTVTSQVVAGSSVTTKSIVASVPSVASASATDSWLWEVLDRAPRGPLRRVNLVSAACPYLRSAYAEPHDLLVLIHRVVQHAHAHGLGVLADGERQVAVPVLVVLASSAVPSYVS